MMTSTAQLTSELKAYEREEREYESLLSERERRLTVTLPPPPLFQVTDTPHPDKQFISTHPDGYPLVHLHPGQWRAWHSPGRFVLILSGAQSGKTALIPWWLLREMQHPERGGPGNYLLVAPTFRLLDKQAVPTLNRAFHALLQLGSLAGGSSGEFRISEEGHKRIWPKLPYSPTRIVFGYAENPDSLESITAKAAILDECGQRSFKLESHEAIQSRLAIHRGRILYLTTPYEFNWLKTDVYDRAERNRTAQRDIEIAKTENREPLPANPADAGYDSVSYESRMNPVFSQEEWDRQKRVLPGWRFSMRYRGLFTRPAGAIYDCFVAEYGSAERFGHLMRGDGFVLPDNWPIHIGQDFGAPNFAAVFLYEVMEEVPGPSGNGPVLRRLTKPQYVAFAEYRPEVAKKMSDHVTAMRAVIKRTSPATSVGGSKSEGQWRKELAAAGWPTFEPDQPDVEIGIGRVYELLAESPPRLYIMDTCPKLIEELKRYSRPVDEDGVPLEGIVDKDLFHGADSLRYVCSWLNRKATGYYVGVFG
jgi:hypothetical protein